MRYTFGNTSIAADRLKLIADFFNPYAKRFITETLNKTVDSAIDLGCGPGYTTNMLYEATKCKNIYGFDFSDSFICYAKKYFNHIKFYNHDITIVPFPVKADIIYVRFVLSHMNNIMRIVKRSERQCVHYQRRAC